MLAHLQEAHVGPRQNGPLRTLQVPDLDVLGGVGAAAEVTRDALLAHNRVDVAGHQQCDLQNLQGEMERDTSC